MIIHLFLQICKSTIAAGTYTKIYNSSSPDMEQVLHVIIDYRKWHSFIQIMVPFSLPLPPSSLILEGFLLQSHNYPIINSKIWDIQKYCTKSLIFLKKMYKTFQALILSRKALNPKLQI